MPSVGKIISLKRHRICNQVDDLGYLNAQIADLQKKAEHIKDELGKLRPGPYEGRLFRATVSKHKALRLDMKAVKKKLSRQFIKANSIETKVTTVRVVSR